MSLTCTIAGHRPAQHQVYNSGYWFSACARCGADLVRPARGGWTAPPSGHRIAWKAGRHFHSIEADYSAVLPVPVPQVTLPARPSPFAAWRRDLVVALPRRAAPAAAIAEDVVDNLRCPRLLLMAVMLGAGLKMLLTFGGAR